MRNKGAIRFVAIAMALVCLYQLSFTFVTSNVRKKAEAYATGPDNVFDKTKEAAFLDSMASTPVYNFMWIREFNYRECQDREINLGLDLKGGMNVVLQVSVEDVLMALSDHSKDENFTAAIKLAKQMQRNSQENFLDLFGNAFQQVAPDGRLANIFATQRLREKISLNNTNEEVLAVLRAETRSAIDNSFNVLRKRIDRFGVAQPNIQPLSVDGQILVELPGIKNPERVKKLLQGTANLEFWETYDNTEVYPYLFQANQKLRDLNIARGSAAGQTEAAAEVAETEPKEEGDAGESLLESIDTTAAAQSAEEFDAEGWKRENPLFALLNPRVMQNGSLAQGASVGFAMGADTAAVNAILASEDVKALFPRSFRVKFAWGVKPIDADGKVYELVALKITNREGLPALSGDVVTDATEEFGDNQADARVSMTMNTEGAKKWARITKNNLGKQVAIVLDDYVYSFPVVQSEIEGGRSSITGNFTIAEAKDLANVLKSGKMPAPAKIIQEEIVGPSLGTESINKGLWSFVIAFIVVLLYMAFFYRRAGWIANVALITNVFFIAGVLASLGAVLTLPGIAGIVLTIGMSIDANILIFERIKEEMNAGKPFKAAVADGYRNAYSAIIDSNLTSLLTAFVLAYFGSGPIYGFAITLGIGILTSLFCAIFITRLIFERSMSRNVEVKMFTKATQNFLKNASIKFLEMRKFSYILSGSLMVISLVSIFGLGFNLGVDFTGGHTYVVRFDKDVTVQDVRAALEEEYGSMPDVKTFGANNQIKITTKYMIDPNYVVSEAEVAEYRAISGNNDPAFVVEPGDVVEAKLYHGLAPFYNELSYDEFVSDGDKALGRMSASKVGPTVADDIRTSAYYSVCFALLIVFLYILFRFSKWQYGLSAVVALTHDVLFILGFYALFKNVMPFSMEVDSSFIAAILTVVGYSINDTVVVFDRIREYLGLSKNRERKVVINQSLNSTLSRTVNTSLTTFVVLLTIFIFGGAVIRGFVFAMMLGIIIGTYSSLFVATPLAYDLMNRKGKKQEEEK